MAYADKTIAILTAAAEASGESHAARQGVIASGFNRLSLGRYGVTLAAVFLEWLQYSSWNGDHGDRADLLRVMRMATDDPVILDCGVAFDEVAAGVDPTDGATHYFDTSIDPPAWTAAPAVKTVQLGRLIFYRNVA